MAGIKDRVSAALHKDTTHTTHDTHGVHGTGVTTGGLHSADGLHSTGGVHSTGGMSTDGLTTGATMHSSAGTTVDSMGRGPLIGGSPVVIDTKTFTKTEDHEVLIEKKAYELQHRPVEKEYIVETRYVGEQRVPGAPTELVGTEAREIEERVVEAPRGDRAVVVENVDVPREILQQQTHLTHGSTYGSSASGTPGSTTNNTTF